MRLELMLVEVVACATVCAIEDDVLEVKFASPLYFAVMEWEPMEKLERASCAEPVERLEDPSETAPSKNVTVPLGVPPNAGWTAAVKSIGCPNADGVRFEVTVVIVEAGLMVCVIAEEVLAEKLASPAYLAVMECAPTERLESVS